MANVNALLKQLHDELLPDPRRVATAQDFANRLVADLQSRSGQFLVRQQIPIGSIARGTALRGFDDLDLLLLLDRGALAGGDDPQPRQVIRELAAWLRHIRAGVVALRGVTVRAQNHSVGVIYRGQGFRLDLVPALRRRGQQHFHIPRRSEDGWIPTRPEHFEREVAQYLPRFRHAMRLLKGWQRARGPRRGWSMPGYAIELLVLAHADGRTVLDAFRSALGAIAHPDARARLQLCGEGTDAVVINEPWTGDNLTAGIDWPGRQKLTRAARDALAVLDEAAEATPVVAERALRRLVVNAA